MPATGRRSSRSGSAGRAKARGSSTARKSTATRKSTAARSTRTSTGARRTTRRASSASRAEKSVEAFREALERTVTISRDRLQEVVDDAVDRGRLTRRDANELVSRMVTRSRQQRNALLRDLERLLDQARSEIESRTAPVGRRASEAAGRAARAAREAADRLTPARPRPARRTSGSRTQRSTKRSKR